MQILYRLPDTIIAQLASFIKQGLVKDMFHLDTTIMERLAECDDVLEQSSIMTSYVTHLLENRVGWSPTPRPWDGVCRVGPGQNQTIDRNLLNRGLFPKP